MIISDFLISHQCRGVYTYSGRHESKADYFSHMLLAEVRGENTLNLLLNDYNVNTKTVCMYYLCL